MWLRFLFLLLILSSQLSHSHADSVAVGGSTSTVTCDSTTVPDLLVTKLDHGVWVANDPTSAVWIWVAEVESADRMTVGAGVPIAPGNANLFEPGLGWHGPLWCLTATAGSATVKVNVR